MLTNDNKYYFINYSIFSFFIFLVLFFQIIKIKAELTECPKNAPILFYGECKSQYCSKEQIDLNICSINNTIIKTQWLNNIIEIGGLACRYINFASYSNGDMVIETTTYPEEPKRYFYGLKKNGRPFFKNENTQEESPYYVIDTSEQNNYKGKYESSAFIIKSSEIGEGNGKEYFLSVSQLEFYAELFDFDNHKVYYKSLEDFSSFQFVKTYRHAFFEYKGSSNNYYYFFGFSSDTDSSYSSNQDLKIHFQKHLFTSINEFSTKQSISGDTITILNAFGKIISSFQTSTELIIIFYQIKTNYNMYFNIRKYSKDFSEPIVDYPIESNINIEENFYKCLHLTGQVGVFSYYKYINNIPYPHVLFKEFNIETNTFENYLSSRYPNSEIILDKKYFYGPVSLNDIVKMNENKICLGTLLENKEYIYLILINIFDDKQIKIRYYCIESFSLYNYRSIMLIICI